jgi:hypothetical protein
VIEQIQKKLECIQWLDRLSEKKLNEMEKQLKPVIKVRFMLLTQNEVQRWGQRAKQDWVQMRDKNTRYFHQITSHQNRKKYIDIIHTNGNAHYDHQQKANIIHQHFHTTQ